MINCIIIITYKQRQDSPDRSNFMNIDKIVNYYPVSLQESVRKEMNACDIGDVIFKAISGELRELSSEPVARLLVPAIKSFSIKSQVAVINTALVAHDVLDTNPVKNLKSEVLSQIASFGEPLAQRILEQVLDADYKASINPSVMLNITKYHSCALELFDKARNYKNEIVLAGCMRWHDIASKEMLTPTFTLSKVAAAHFHHEFADDVAKLMVKHYQNTSYEDAQDESYKFSNFFEQVLPHVQNKSILHELINQSSCNQFNALKYLGLIAENDPVGVSKHLQSANPSNTILEMLKCRIASQTDGIQSLCDANLLRSDRSADVALILTHADSKACSHYFEQNTVDNHTLALLKNQFLKFKDKFKDCNLRLKNPGVFAVITQNA